MPVRPNLEKETVEELNEKLQDVIRVDPESVSVDERIKILLAELESLTNELEETEELNEQLSNIREGLYSVENEVKNQNLRM